MTVFLAMLALVAACAGSGDQGTIEESTTVGSGHRQVPRTEVGDRAHAELVDGAHGYARSDDRLRVYYEVHGEGDPLVLVHGWAGSIKYNWALTGWIDALQSVRQVVALDIRGHGESDKPHEQGVYGYADMAQDVLAVMDHLGIERADYVGYSLGAFSGVHLLGHDRSRFRSFVLMGIGDEDDASVALAPVIAGALRTPDPADVADPVARAYRALADVDPRNDHEALALAALEMWPEGYPLDLGGPGLSEVDVPVLILNGANDLPYAATDQTLAAAIPSAVLVEVPDADHLSVLGDQRFKQEVLSFLDE